MGVMVKNKVARFFMDHGVHYCSCLILIRINVKRSVFTLAAQTIFKAKDALLDKKQHLSCGSLKAETVHYK